MWTIVPITFVIIHSQFIGGNFAVGRDRIFVDKLSGALAVCSVTHVLWWNVTWLKSCGSSLAFLSQRCVYFGFSKAHAMNSTQVTL